MNPKSDYYRSFLQRTDALSNYLGITVRELAASIGISERTLFASRKDDSVISNKTWYKLEKAEQRLGEGALQFDLAAVDNEDERAHLLREAYLIDRLHAYPTGSKPWMNEFFYGLYQAEIDVEAFLANVTKLTKGVLNSEAGLEPLAKRIEWQTGKVQRELKSFFFALEDQIDKIGGEFEDASNPEDPSLES